MSTTSATGTGSASRWGPLWGSRPGDWALSEDMQRPTYEAALERTGLQPSWRVLDIGCGAGAFLRLVAEGSAEPRGIDASEALIAFAQTRLPQADLRVGEMEELPWDDDRFDLVTVVVREAGPGWAAGGIHEQPAIDDHAVFMDALAQEGFVVFAGPVAGSEQGRLRVLLNGTQSMVDEECGERKGERRRDEY